MDRTQDQLDVQAGQQLVARMQELSAPRYCANCGGDLLGLQHAFACGVNLWNRPSDLGSTQTLTAMQEGMGAARAETPQEKYLRVFKELTDGMVALTTRKNADYAGSADPYKNFREFGTMGFLVRMSDKWSRIKNLLGSGKAPSVKDEAIEDTLMDLATYSLLLITWLRAEKP